MSVSAVKLFKIVVGSGNIQDIWLIMQFCFGKVVNGFNKGGKRLSVIPDINEIQSS